MLTNSLKTQGGLANLLPIAFLHTRMANKKIGEINRGISYRKAVKILSPEAGKRLQKIQRDYANYPALYRQEHRNFQAWHEGEIQRLTGIVQ